MAMTSRWLGSAVERRTVLRGAGIGLAGLAGAALLGCGGSKKPASSTTTSGTGSSAANNGAPKNIKRADGFDPKIGTVPVNEKKVVLGGTYRRSAADTSRENDPDVSIAQADWEIIGDRLAYANGF